MLEWKCARCLMVVVLISYGLLYVLEMMRKLVDSVRKPVVQEKCTPSTTKERL